MLENLRAIREDKDLSQEDVAVLLHIHQTTYSKYELEKANVPIETLRRLAIYFNTSIDYLVDLTDEMRPYPRKKQR